MLPSLSHFELHVYIIQPTTAKRLVPETYRWQSSNIHSRFLGLAPICRIGLLHHRLPLPTFDSRAVLFLLALIQCSLLQWRRNVSFLSALMSSWLSLRCIYRSQHLSDISVFLGLHCCCCFQTDFCLHSSRDIVFFLKIILCWKLWWRTAEEEALQTVSGWRQQRV